VAEHRQVFCVTHLPQVAAHARHHFHVDKSAAGPGKGGKASVRTRLRGLDPNERVEELARMLGGKRVTAEARANARGLLEGAETVAPN
jgi:DNA repair protein RecN (Recombination protein N)